MSMITCGICGTQYPDSENVCPICDTPRDYSANSTADMNYDVSMEEHTAPPRKKKLFDYDEVTGETLSAPQEENEEEDYEEYEEEEPESNTGLVVILVIVIALLLLAVGFMFFRFFLPNIIDTEDNAPVAATTPVETAVPTAETEETEEPAIPCTDLSIPGGKVELKQQGQFWLMNVQVFPQNTTDTLTFYSEDETVATVDESGRVSAVGEGKTAIHVVCGDVKLKCSVTVDFSQDEEPAEEESVPALSVEEEPSDTENTKETEAAEATEETEATEATEETKPAVSGDTVLKLKKTDITMSVRYSSYQMELDCDIPSEEIKWLTMDSTKAIVIDGLITATGPGTTTIKAMYKGQVAECIVRCNFG